MYCESCGNLVPDGQAFCSNCGAAVAQAAPAAQPAPAPAPVAQPEPIDEPEEPVYTAPVNNTNEVIPDDDFDDIMNMLRKPKRRDDFRGRR